MFPWILSCLCLLCTSGLCPSINPSYLWKRRQWTEGRSWRQKVSRNQFSLWNLMCYHGHWSLHLFLKYGNMVKESKACSFPPWSQTIYFLFLLQGALKIYQQKQASLASHRNECTEMWSGWESWKQVPILVCPEKLYAIRTDWARGREGSFFGGDLKSKELFADARPTQGSTGQCLL